MNITLGTNTPRLDEQVLAYLAADGSEMVHASFARQLEIELAAAKKRIADCEFVMDHRYKIIERQEQRCNEANARAEKAEADTARLDWLQSSISLHVNSIALRGDIRDAIDFAMKEASK